MVKKTGDLSPLTYERRDQLVYGRFKAMGCPCEVLIETDSKRLAKTITRLAAEEAWRIEKKFSRYRQDNIVYQINNSAGQAIKVDAETARLLDFAEQCYSLSDGLFDVTSGVLRRVWKFDRSSSLPSAKKVEAALADVGWEKISWNSPEVVLPKKMEIDFGGIGKEYAVDRSLQILMQATDCPLLVNFGGDLIVSGPRYDGSPWNAGVAHPDFHDHANKLLHLSLGALATSGDAYRYLQKDGVRYSHVLNPNTGWPVKNAPRSVTVAAANCTQAGMLATFALLNGEKAEDFLKSQDTHYWIVN